MLSVWRAAGAAVRGTGAMLDALGAHIQGALAPREGLLPPLSRLPLGGTTPRSGAGSFVAPNAALIGDVTIGEGASIWYGATLRGDVNPVSVGANSNVQDRAVVHASRHTTDGTARPAVIGSQVTIGHGAIVHAATVEDECLIGMGARVLDGAVIRRGAIVAAGAVVTPGTEVPSGQVWAGCPARYLRDLEAGETAFLTASAVNYAALAAEHWAENSKTWLRVLHEDTIEKDIGQRDPNDDEQLGLRRDHLTRSITSGPNQGAAPS